MTPPDSAPLHGLREFYRAAWIEKLGLTTVAAEADWPGAYRVNRYVRDFTRFPHWMWPGADAPDFVA